MNTLQHTSFIATFFIAFFGLLLVPLSSFAATASISATPETQYTNGAVTVTWSSTDAWKCVGTGFATGNATSGSVTVYPVSSGVKTYTVTCYDETPACSLVQTGSYIEDAPGVNSCFSNISYSPNGSCSPNGAQCQSSTARGGGTWTIRDFQCQGSCTTASASDTVTVNNPPPPPEPSVDLTASPSVVTAGSSVLISWSSARATSCDGTNFSTGGNTSGSVTITPTTTKTYSILCYSEVYSATPGVWVDSGISDVTDLWCSSGPPPPSYSNYYTNNSCPSSNPAGTACVGADECYVNTWASQTISPGETVNCNLFSDRYVCNGGSTPNLITDSVSVVYNNPPNAPSITAPTTGVINTAYTFSFQASDPNGDTIRYRQDWDNDGVINTNLPATGYTNSNTLLSTTRTWTSVGTYLIRALTQDINGANSGWTSHTITISNPTPQCSDGINNDTDAWTDYPNDPGCTSAADTTESPNPQCSDGLDNDSDGLIDLADYGCTGIADTTETPNPQCSDGIDNNGNGLIDLADTGACTGPSDGNEEPLPAASLSLIGPTLVQPGKSALMIWSAANTQAGSCTITGTNGDSFTLSGSSGTQSSSVLSLQTRFTLRCTDLNGVLQSQSATVRIAPSFQEI